MLMATPAISLMESWKNTRMEAMCPGRQGEAGGQGEQCGQGEPGGQDELGGHGRRAEPVRIGDLSIEGFYVPHRQELTQTVGFWLRGPERTLIYIPDIDRWTPDVVAIAAMTGYPVSRPGAITRELTAENGSTSSREFSSHR